MTGAVLALGGVAYAQQGALEGTQRPRAVDKRDEGLYVEADSLHMDRAALTAVFSGSVVARQQERELRANRVEIYYLDDDGQLSPSIIRAFEQVYYIGEDIIAENADTAVFDLRAQTLEMRGKLRLLQGESTITGTEANIDLNTGQAVVRGGQSDRQRVRGNFVLQPN